MSEAMPMKSFDVVVLGGGSAGVSAAISAAKNGAKTLLIESGPMVGGELLSGLPVDGALNARGEWIVGGVMGDLLKECDKLNGYVGEVFDWRLNWGVCYDPEILKVALIEALASVGVTVLLYTLADGVVMDGGRVAGVTTLNKAGRSLVTGRVYVDCSGDGNLAVWAGAPWEKGAESGDLQPVSLVFRMGNVDYGRFLSFMEDNPDQFILAENPVIAKTPAECAAEVRRSGLPFAVLGANGSILNTAIDSGRMYETTAVYLWPTSVQRGEVGLNTTRLPGVDAMDVDSLSASLATLTSQVRMCSDFMRESVPGFERAYIASTAPRVGVRETRRVMGEYVLSTDDVLEGRKFPTGVAKGAHHVDLHGRGRAQERVPVKDGRSYDIPYECLIPREIENVLVAGRCFSSSREANGSARVMGPCMAMGQAAGTAAAMASEAGLTDVRQVPTRQLRERLATQGAVLEGTH